MPASTPPTPLTIGRYALHAEIASGGMATVHFARLLGPGGFSRMVAAKRLLPHMVRDGAFTAMLLDEARLAARIRHPNVVSTLDVISTGDELIVVMEYVHGESLHKLAQTASDLGEPISARFAASIIIEALHGLHAAHEAKDESGNLLGVVHRDISPQNILVGVDGVTRIADFGIAKAAGRSYQTRDGTIKGKLAYMAPEQVEGGELTRATDVFAVSVVLWELLTGQQLFDGVTDAEVMHRVLTYEIPAPSSLVPGLPEFYDRIVARGLARNKALRFGSAREMALELEAASTPVRVSEIGGWVERVASDTLRRRSLSISKIERSLTDEVSPLAATKPVTPAARPSADPPNTAAKVSWDSGTPGRSSSWLLGAVAGLAGVGALLWVAGAHRPPPTAASAASVSALVSAAASAAGTAAPPLPGVLQTPPSSTASQTPPAARPTKDAGMAADHRPASVKSAGVPLGKPKSSANCDPPYSIDASGRRIFKLECM